MGYMWTFACETCEIAGPQMKRGPGGLFYDDRDLRRFLIDHEYHLLHLLTENESIEQRLSRYD